MARSGNGVRARAWLAAALVGLAPAASLAQGDIDDVPWYDADGNLVEKPTAAAPAPAPARAAVAPPVAVPSPVPAAAPAAEAPEARPPVRRARMFRPPVPRPKAAPPELAAKETEPRPALKGAKTVPEPGESDTPWFDAEGHRVLKPGEKPDLAAQPPEADEAEPTRLASAPIETEVPAAPPKAPAKGLVIELTPPPPEPGEAPPESLSGQALAAYEAGDKAQALHLWVQAGLEGDARADLFAGNMYVSGEGTDGARPELALAHYERSVAAGNDEARVQLAALYREGRGVKADMKKAVDLLYRAAVNGHAGAQVELAETFAQGDNDRVAKDLAHARDWYRLAALQNVVFAQVKLAQLYLEGIGVGRDEVEGMAWLEAAVRVALAPEEPAWSKRILPLDAVIATDKDGRTLRQIVFDLDDRYRTRLSELQLKKADEQVARFGLPPL